MLVADDEQYLLDIWVEVFKLLDVDVLTASSGLDAISVLKDNEVDLVITDVRMRGSDGFVLLEYIRNEGLENLPTIVCSGFFNAKSDELAELNVTRVIGKPFSVREELDYFRALLND